MEDSPCVKKKKKLTVGDPDDGSTTVSSDCKLRTGGFGSSPFKDDSTGARNIKERTTQTWNKTLRPRRGIVKQTRGQNVVVDSSL